MLYECPPCEHHYTVSIEDLDFHLSASIREMHYMLEHFEYLKEFHNGRLSALNEIQLYINGLGGFSG